MDPELDEAELARRAREGDREALAELIERVRLSLFGLAYAELRHYEDAQDAVAAALLQICRHIGELREPERLKKTPAEPVRRGELHTTKREKVEVLPDHSTLARRLSRPSYKEKASRRRRKAQRKRTLRGGSRP